MTTTRPRHLAVAILGTLVALTACGGTATAPSSPVSSSASAPGKPSASAALDASRPAASEAAAASKPAPPATSAASKPAASAPTTSAASGQLTKITYAVPSTEDANLLPQNVALKQGFFAKHGLDVELSLVIGGPNVIAGVQAGSLAAAVTSTQLVFNALSQNAQIVSVAEEVAGFGMQVVMSSKVAKDKNMAYTTSTQEMINDVKALRIGGQSPGSSITTMFQGILKQNGKPADWATAGNTGTTTASLAALQNGVVDGIICSAPCGQIAEAGGYGKIIWRTQSIEQFRDATYGVTFVSPSWADSHTQTVENIVLALDDAQRWIQANPDQATNMAVSLFPSLPVSLMAEILKDMNYAPAARISERGMKNAQNLSNQFSLTTAPVSDALLEKSYTNKYYKGPQQ